MKRRNFITTLASSAAVVLLYPLRAFSLEKADIVTKDDPTGIALGYIHDATKTDTKKYPKRKGPEGATQFCSNCMFLQGEEKEITGIEGKWIGCQLFPKKAVNSKGWCNSWTKKP